MAENERLSRWLSAGRRRLRTRHTWRGAAIGGLGASGTAAIGVAVLRLLVGIEPVVAGALAMGLPLLGSIVGAAVAWSRPVADARSVALVLDRIAGSDERIITALHLGALDDARAPAARQALEAVEVAGLAAQLPVRWPKRLWLGPVLVGLAVAAVGLPRVGWPVLAPSRPATSLTEAGTRLQDRLAEIRTPDEAPGWPESIEREVESLAHAMQGETISEVEAAERLDELAEQIEAFEASLQDAEGSDDALSALEEAAKALDNPATQALRDALSRGDAQAAEQAARQLQESTSQGDAATRQRAADAMRQAGRRLGQSGDPELAAAGRALEGASPQAGQGELSPEQSEALLEQLQQARRQGQQMQQDRAALDRAQRLAGAVEGARQQLGSAEPAGQSSQQADPASGASSEGQGTDAGAASGLSAGARAGREGHTWEDQGESAGGGSRSEGGDPRQDDRREGQHIDDFEKLYDAVRLSGAQPRVAGAGGRRNEEGRVDELRYRLTTAEESATVGRVALPDGYREAVSAAIDAESVPPAYRNAVRDYFAEMD